GAQLLEAELPTVDADAQHEVLVVQLVRLQHRRTTAVDAGPALRVEAEPPQAPSQVGRIDAGETAMGVDGFDPRAYVQRIVVLLGAFVGVQRLTMAQRPLALPAGPPRRRGGRGCTR